MNPGFAGAGDGRMREGAAFLSGAREVLRRARRAVPRPASPRRYAARLWRRCLIKTIFVGVTGSHGKTTATALLGDMLAEVAPTKVKSRFNTAGSAARTVLGVVPWRHHYCVQEVSGHQPGAVEDAVRYLRPSVGLVTAIGDDHGKSFQRSRQAVAAEKARLVHCLGGEGLAVLNADDPLVAAMAEGCRCRVATFGAAETAGLRLLGAASPWPDRLSMEIAWKGERHLVRTRLVGVHWSVSVLGALLAALELGVPMPVCLAVIAGFSPVYNRMSVHEGPNGSRIVLDAEKASWSGLEACLAFLGSASAPRRTVVLGSLADYRGSARQRYKGAARMAAEAADRVICTTQCAQRVRRLAGGELEGRLLAIERPQDVLCLLERDAVAGEIVYVKATGADGLAEVFASRRRAPP